MISKANIYVCGHKNKISFKLLLVLTFNGIDGSNILTTGIIIKHNVFLNLHIMPAGCFYNLYLILASSVETQ